MRIREINDQPEKHSQDNELTDGLFLLPVTINGLTKPNLHKFSFDLAMVKVNGTPVGNVKIDHQQIYRNDDLYSYQIVADATLPVFSMTSRMAVTASLNDASILLYEDNGFGNSVRLIDESIIVDGKVLGINPETGKVFSKDDIDRYQV